MTGKTKPELVNIAIIIATFLTAIEGTIVSTAMPKIVQDLGGNHLYSWVISVYLLATVLSSAIQGKLADLYGRKPMFQLSVLIFLIGSISCGLSQNMQQLIFFRLIQGIGAGGLVSIPMTIIGDIFTLEERAKIQGWINTVWGISGILGPLAGGFIVDTFTWHWIFFMNLPFGVTSLIIMQRALHEQITKKKQTIDFPGIITFTICMTAFLYSLELVKNKQLNSLLAGCLIIAILFFSLFLWIETKMKEPMVSLSLFKNRFINVSYFASFSLGFILVVVTFFIPLWVQGVNHRSATLSGIAVFPLSLTWIFGSFLTNRLLRKTSIAFIAILGTLIVVLGCIGLLFLQIDTVVFWIMVITGILGVGFGLTFTLFTVVVQSAVVWKRRGSAMGVLGLMRSLGQAIGISVSGVWLTDNLSGAMLAASLHNIFWILAIVGFLALADSGLLIGKTLVEPVDEKD